VTALEPWMLKSRGLQESFEDFKVTHVYQEFNGVVDALPNEALLLHSSQMEVKKL